MKVPALNDRSARLAQLFPHIPLWRTRHTKHVYIQDLLLASLQKIVLYLQLIVQLHHRQENEMKKRDRFFLFEVYSLCDLTSLHLSPAESLLRSAANVTRPL